MNGEWDWERNTVISIILTAGNETFPSSTSTQFHPSNLNTTNVTDTVDTEQDSNSYGTVRAIMIALAAGSLASVTVIGNIMVRHCFKDNDIDNSQ